MGTPRGAAVPMSPAAGAPAGHRGWSGPVPAACRGDTRAGRVPAQPVCPRRVTPGADGSGAAVAQPLRSCLGADFIPAGGDTRALPSLRPPCCPGVGRTWGQPPPPCPHVALSPGMGQGASSRAGSTERPAQGGLAPGGDTCHCHGDSAVGTPPSWGHCYGGTVL